MRYWISCRLICALKPWRSGCVPINEPCTVSRNNKYMNRFVVRSYIGTREWLEDVPNNNNNHKSSNPSTRRRWGTSKNTSWRINICWLSWGTSMMNSLRLCFRSCMWNHIRLSTSPSTCWLHCRAIPSWRVRSWMRSSTYSSSSYSCRSRKHQ